MFARERFPHSYKECFVSLFNRCGISQFTPFGASPVSTSFCGSMSSLTHCSVSGPDTICNRSSPPPSAMEKFPHLYKKKCFVFLSNRCGISQEQWTKQGTVIYLHVHSELDIFSEQHICISFLLDFILFFRNRDLKNIKDCTNEPIKFSFLGIAEFIIPICCCGAVVNLLSMR